MQHEITTRHALLDAKGHLVEPGYTKGLLMDYDRKAIKGGALRIKEQSMRIDSLVIAYTGDINAQFRKAFTCLQERADVVGHGRDIGLFHMRFT